MPIDAAAKIKLIHDEALKIRNSSDAGLEARNFIKAHPELFQDEQSLSEFALQLEENGVLPGIDLRNTPGVPAGTLTREQLQQLSNDTTIDPLFRAFAALADSQYSNLLSSDGKFRVSDALDKLVSLQPQFACVYLAKSLTTQGDGAATFFSYLDSACTGSSDGLVGYYDLDTVVNALDNTNPDPVWQNRLSQAGLTLAQLKDWRDHYDDPKYGVLRETGGGHYVTLDSLRAAGYDSSSGTVTITDQSGLKISFLVDGTSSTLAPDNTLTINKLDHSIERHFSNGAVQYLDAQGVLQKIDYNGWITTYTVGGNGPQASQVDSKDGALTWRYDGQGWRLHDVAKLNASFSQTDKAAAAAAYENSVVGDPHLFMDLMNYLPEQATDPAGVTFKTKNGDLWITYRTDGSIEEKMSGFKLLIPTGGDLSNEQLTLANGTVWKSQDGLFKHFDRNGALIDGEMSLLFPPTFDPTHNTVLLKFADNSSRLINADASSVRTLADGTVVEVSSQLSVSSITFQGSKYFIGNDSAVQRIELNDHTVWTHVSGNWVHLGTNGAILTDSGSGPNLPFQLQNGALLFSQGRPPVITRVIHPSGESTSFVYGSTVDGASVSADQLTQVVDSSGQKMELQNDGYWHFVNPAGREYAMGAVSDFKVSVDGQGNVTAISQSDINPGVAEAIQFTADGRAITSSSGHVTSISYPDGTSQTFRWSFEDVVSFTDRDGQVWGQNPQNLGMGETPDLVTTTASGESLSANVSVDLSGKVSLSMIRPTDGSWEILHGRMTAADGRIVTLKNEHPEQVTFLDGQVYGFQQDGGFKAPDGSTYYLKDGLWKTADGIQPSKQADYLQLDTNGGISLAVRSGSALEITNYYPNGHTLRTSSPLSIDLNTARNIAQSIADNGDKLLPELTTLSVADRLFVDQQFFALTNPPKHLMDITSRFSNLDKARVEDLLYLTGEMQDGKIRNSITELHQILANAGTSARDQQIAQQQIVYLLASSTAAQIQQFTNEYRDRYGSDFFSTVTSLPGFSASFREALPTLLLGIDGMRAGSQNSAFLNDSSFDALKRIALKYDDIQLFTFAFQYASPQQRDAFKNSPDGLAKLGQHFYGDDFQDATAYATIGSISLHRLVTKNTNFLFIDSDRIFSDLVINTTDKERMMYRLGKDIAQTNNFDLANPGQNADLAARTNALLKQYPDLTLDSIKDFYNTTFEDLKRASWPSQQILALPGEDPSQPQLVAKYEDYLINGGPTLITSLLDESKTRSPMWPSNPITYYDSNSVFAKIEKMSFDDWKHLKDDDYYNQLLLSLHTVLKDGDNSIPSQAWMLGINYTQGDDFAIAKRLLDEKRQMALKTDGTLEQNYILSQSVGLRTTLEVFHENPPPRSPESVARVISYLYSMPVSEMVKLRDANSDYANQVKLAIDSLPDDAKNLAMIMFNYVVDLTAQDFSKLSSSQSSNASTAVANSDLQPASVSLSPKDQLSYDTVTQASESRLAIDRALVAQEQMIESLGNSNLNKPDLFTAVLSLSKADRLLLLQDLNSTTGQHVYANLLNKFSSQEQEVLKHALNRLKDEDSPGAQGHLSMFDAVETVRLYTLQVAGDPASIQTLLQSLDGDAGPQSDRASKIKMVLDYNQSFHSDVFADVLNIAGAEWRDRMVTALTIRPEAWKDIVNDTVFRSMLSESGFAAFVLRNDALQGMVAQRDAILRDLVTWETTGKIDNRNFQLELNNFQASIDSYVEAKRAYTQNFLMLASIVLTLPVGAEASLAVKALTVAAASLLQVVGMQAGMGSDYNLATDAMPDLLHGAANMTMLVAGGALADRLLSRLIAPEFVTIVSAEAAPVLSKGLPALVGAIQSNASETVIATAARDLAVKILGDNATDAAVSELSATLLNATRLALSKVSMADRALIATVSMEGVGLPSHYLASVGSSIWENLRSGKSIESIVREALDAGHSGLVPTAAAILVGVGLSFLVEAATSALRSRAGNPVAETAGANSGNDVVATDVDGVVPGGAKVSLRDVIQTQIVGAIQQIDLLLQQAANQLSSTQKIELVKAEVMRIIKQIDDLFRPPLNFALETGTPLDGPTSNPQQPAPSSSSSSSSSQPAVKPALPGDADASVPASSTISDSDAQPPKPIAADDGSSQQSSLNEGQPAQSDPPGDGSVVPPADSAVVKPTGASDGSSAGSTSTNVSINKMSMSELSELSAKAGVPMETLEQLSRVANSAANPADDMTAAQLTAAQQLASKPIQEMNPGELDVVAKGTGVPYETLKAIALGIPSEAIPVVTPNPNLQQILLKYGSQIARSLADSTADAAKAGGIYVLKKLVSVGVGLVFTGGALYLAKQIFLPDHQNNSTKPGDSGGSADPMTGQPLTPTPNTTVNVTNYIRTADDRKKLLFDLSTSVQHIYRDSTTNDVHRYLTSADLAQAMNDPEVRRRLAADGFDPDAVLNWLNDPKNWPQLYDKNRTFGGETVIDEDSLAAFYNTLPNR